MQWVIPCFFFICPRLHARELMRCCQIQNKFQRQSSPIYRYIFLIDSYCTDDIFSSTCDGITLISVFGNKLRETAPIRNHFCFRQSNHQPKLGYQITEIMNTVDKKKKRSCFLYRIIFTMFSHRQRQNNFPSRDHIEFQFRKHEDRTTRHNTTETPVFKEEEEGAQMVINNGV